MHFFLSILVQRYIVKKDEVKAYFKESGVEAGCDEAGRGCLAGPVFAAAVILDSSKEISPFIRDSKKLRLDQRERAASWIEQNAVAFAVESCSAEEIDQWNILQCSFIAMHRALDQLKEPFDRILVDGNRFKPYQQIPFECIVKGDDQFTSIAAASILAKVYRDRYMLQQSDRYPMYQWQKNKGYPTKNHIQAIEQHGISPIHRKTFSIKSKQLRLFS